MKLQGYNDYQINDILEGAEDIDEYRDIIREAKKKFLEEFQKVEFIYPESLTKEIENISFPVKEAYVKKDFLENRKEVD